MPPCGSVAQASSGCDCENNHSWISLSLTSLSGESQHLVIKIEFMVFISQKGFWHSFLKTQPSESTPFPFAFTWLVAFQAVRYPDSLSDPSLCLVTQANMAAF